MCKSAPADGRSWVDKPVVWTCCADRVRIGHVRALRGTGSSTDEERRDLCVCGRPPVPPVSTWDETKRSGRNSWPRPTTHPVATAGRPEAGEYGADSINILEGLEAVRKRPGMYIGSTGERGLHHLIWEVVDNSVDEAMAGYATRVDVTLLADGGVEVVDDGRGIPCRHPRHRRPHRRGRHDPAARRRQFDSDSYAVSGGLHGVGISVVNALSTKVELEIRRDGFSWSQTYLNSEPQTLHQGAPTRKRGTTTRFWPDPAIFTETTRFNAETVARRLQEMAFLNKGLTITLTDNRPQAIEAPGDPNGDGPAPGGTEIAEAVQSQSEKAAAKPKTRTYYYADGLIDYIKHINKRSKTPIHQSVIGFSGKGTGHEVEIAMQWNDGYLSRSTLSPTPSTRMRAARTKRVFAPR